MIYTEKGDSITIEMTRNDYEQLMLILGYACGAASAKNPAIFYTWLAFVNDLNATNPNFTPREIPAEGRSASKVS